MLLEKPQTVGRWTCKWTQPPPPSRHWPRPCASLGLWSSSRGLSYWILKWTWGRRCYSTSILGMGRLKFRPIRCCVWGHRVTHELRLWSSSWQPSVLTHWLGSLASLLPTLAKPMSLLHFLLPTPQPARRFASQVLASLSTKTSPSTSELLDPRILSSHRAHLSVACYTVTSSSPWLSSLASRISILSTFLPTQPLLLVSSFLPDPLYWRHSELRSWALSSLPESLSWWCHPVSWPQVPLTRGWFPNFNLQPALLSSPPDSGVQGPAWHLHINADLRSQNVRGLGAPG